MVLQPDWKKLVSRTSDVLHWDSGVSIRREPFKIGNIFWGTRNDLVIKNNTPLGSWYEQNPDIEDQSNLGEFCKKEMPELNEIFDNAIAVIDRDLTAIPGNSPKDLRDLYGRFRTDMALMIFSLVCIAIPVRRLNAVIGDGWSDVEEQILRPYRPTLIGRESRAILKVQKESHGKTKDWLRKKADLLAKEFGFIHSEYVSDSWTSHDYETVLQDSPVEIADRISLDLKLFDEFEQWLISIIQKMSYLHDEGKTALVRTNWALRETLKNLGFDDSLLRLSEQEFLQWIETGFMPKKEDIEKRKNYFAILSQNEKYEFFFGKNDVEALMEDQGLKNFLIRNNPSVIKGTIASKGFVKGIARIVMTQDDSRNLKKGEILVASMTTPAYIDAMRRASAYVTDEGGVICHAAIVAREFNKPCIVGTKIGTQIIKDGSMVEVDANIGLIRVIS